MERKVSPHSPRPKSQQSQSADALVFMSEDAQTLQSHLQTALSSHIGAEMRRLGESLRQDIREELRRRGTAHLDTPHSGDEATGSQPDRPSRPVPPTTQAVIPARVHLQPQATHASATPPAPIPPSLPGMLENDGDREVAVLGGVEPDVPTKMMCVSEQTDATVCSNVPQPVGRQQSRGRRQSLIAQEPHEALQQASEMFRARQLRRTLQQQQASMDGMPQLDARDVPEFPNTPSRHSTNSSYTARHRASKESGAFRPSTLITTRDSKGLHGDAHIFGDQDDDDDVCPTSSTEAREKTWSKNLEDLVRSDKFDYCLCAILLSNALLIGLQVDWQARHFTDEVPGSFRVVGLTFCVLFTLELALRIKVYRWRFFHLSSRGVGWNIFDTMLVVLQLAEEITTLYDITDNSTSSFQVIRLVRVLRLLRVIRVIRLVRFVAELRKLLYLIVASFWSFVWTAVLLLMLTYIVGVFFTQVVIDHHIQDPVSVPQDSDLVEKYFSNTGESMFSLYKSITGGVDWGDIQSPLSKQISPLMGGIFSTYVAFAVLVILNLVTGVFVDGAMKLTKEDKQAELLKKVRRAFGQVDSDSTGDITWTEFTENFLSPEMHEVFRAIEINMAKAEDLFNFLDQDGSGALSAEEFAVGAINLQGPAKALDLAMFSVQTRDALARLEEKIVGLPWQWNKAYVSPKLDPLVQAQPASAALADARDISGPA